MRAKALQGQSLDLYSRMMRLRLPLWIRMIAGIDLHERGACTLCLIQIEWSLSQKRFTALRQQLPELLKRRFGAELHAAAVFRVFDA